MDGGDLWSSRLSSSSFRRYQLISDAYLGDELEVEDEQNQEFSCPFCGDEFDIVGLFGHMDEEHQVELKNGVCPLCVTKVGVHIISHITMQHGNILKIQRKRRMRRGGANSMFTILRKELRDGNRQSLFGGSSFVPSSSNLGADPLLSCFIYSSNFAENLRKKEPGASKNACLLPEILEEKSTKSVQQPLLSKKDYAEKARKCEFIQDLLASTMLDDIL